MVCHASRNALELWLDIGFKASPSAKESTLRMVMSLKRHAYDFIEDGESKEQNSVCYHSVNVPALVRDAEDVGKQFQLLQESNRFALLSESVDFTAASRRRFRFDEHRGRDGFNHFYPLDGPGVWNCDMKEYEWLQALRRLQVDPDDNTPRAKFAGWNPFAQDRPEWQKLRRKLVEVSGAEDVLSTLEAEVRKPKKKPAAAASSVGGLMFHRAPGLSDDESDEAPSPRRGSSKSDVSSSADSGSGSDSDGGFW